MAAVGVAESARRLEGFSRASLVLNHARKSCLVGKLDGRHLHITSFLNIANLCKTLCRQLTYSNFLPAGKNPRAPNPCLFTWLSSTQTRNSHRSRRTRSMRSSKANTTVPLGYHDIRNPDPCSFCCFLYRSLGLVPRSVSHVVHVRLSQSGCCRHTLHFDRPDARKAVRLCQSECSARFNTQLVR